MDQARVRLLVIDDSEDDARLLERRLVNAGFVPRMRRVSSESCLCQALRDETWDLVVCDFRMPGFGGDLALERVKELHPELPFVFVSGTMPPSSLDLLRKADGYAPKDAPELLLDVLRKHLPVRDRREGGFSSLEAIVRCAFPAGKPSTSSEADPGTCARAVLKDLRGTLRAIQVWAHAALMESTQKSLSSSLRECLDQVAGAAVRQDLLLRALETYTEVWLGPISLEACDLETVLGEVVRKMKPDLDRAGAQVTVSGPLGSVWGDRTLLGCALGSLLSEALKFLAPGQKPVVSVRVEERGFHRRLWIEDEASRIPPRPPARQDPQLGVFPSGQGHPWHELGPVVAAGACRRLGGRTGVMTEAGKGMRAWLELFRVQSGPERPAASSVPEASEGPSPGRERHLHGRRSSHG
jgi:signal transduction histidine kinase